MMLPVNHATIPSDGMVPPMIRDASFAPRKLKIAKPVALTKTTFSAPSVMTDSILKKPIVKSMLVRPAPSWKAVYHALLATNALHAIQDTERLAMSVKNAILQIV